MGPAKPSLRLSPPRPLWFRMGKVVAVRLEGKSAEQIRQELAIEGDLTKEEVEAIQEEDEWDTLVERVSG